MASILDLDLSKGKYVISKHIYGHFAEHLGRCIYNGLWVGEDSPIPNTRGIRNDIVEALKEINIPNLRWPGGCFADNYHWKDGIGPREDRPYMINTDWGHVVENNHFGTHEFMDLCEQLECEPYICGNVGSGTVKEMQEWVEYLTFDGESPMANLRKKNGREKPWSLNFFGIGNENWGCGGLMKVETYVEKYRQYQTYVSNYSGNEIKKIACGPSEADYHWTEVVMRECTGQTPQLENSTHDKPIKSAWEYYRPQLWGLGLHYYVRNRLNYTSATKFNEDLWFEYMQRAVYMEELITNHSKVMDKYDPDKNVALIVDEWGSWYEPEPGTHPRFLYQQNTLRDALIAGINLNIFNNHCDRVKMANIAQLINVLQALILTEGSEMILTPTYHVFEMYKVHQDSTLIPINIETRDYQFGGGSLPIVNASASRDQQGKVHLTLCNLDPHNSEEITCRLDGDKAISSVNARILTAETMNMCNTFEQPEQIKPITFDDIKIQDNLVSFVLPGKSVLAVELEF
ncbi:alpha-N-arabinofuranosidase [Neobacillus cucumis]|uniref:alpha-N-arabinofuranosidase n=1 Tax=Neobacillus cucumis TaxID=1740721 RepID=UPI00268277A4